MQKMLYLCTRKGSNNTSIMKKITFLFVALVCALMCFAQETTSKEAITRIGVSQYDYLGTEIDKKEYARIMQTCPEAFRQYSNGKKLRNIGWGLLGGGMGMFAVGLGVCFGIPRTPQNGLAVEIAGLTVFSAGLIAACGVGIPLISVGYHRENNAYKIYNNKCGAAATPITFNLKADHNGLGIAMQF